MNRQSLANLHISSLHLQQGLLASLALAVTLIGGQQMVRWEQASQPAPSVLHHVIPQQQHFSAVSSYGLDSNASAARYELIEADETQTAHSQPVLERWVF